MKKIITLLIVLVIATAAMAYLYFSRLNEKNAQNDGVLSIATYNAAMVFEFTSNKNFYQLMSEQDLFGNFLGADKQKELVLLKSYMSGAGSLQRLLNEQKIYVSIISAGKTIELLITAQLPDGANTALTNALKKEKGISAAGNDLYLVKLSDSAQVFTGVRSGFLFLSSSANIIKERLAAKTGLMDAAFERYIKDAIKFNKNSLISLFINFKKFTPLISSMIAGNVDGELARLNKLDAFADLSYNYSKEKLLFHGTTIINDPKNYYHLFDNLDPEPISINSILPSNTVNYSAFVINDYPNWLGKLDQYFQSTGNAKKTTDVLARIKKNYLIDLRASFSKYFNNQFVSFQLKTGEKLGAVALNNGTKIKQLLTDMSSPYNEDISIFKQDDLLYCLFGDIFVRFGRPFYTIKGNYLIFANNASTVQSFISSYDDNALLSNQQFYIDFKNQFPETGNVSFYINLKASKDIFRNNLHLTYYKHFLADSGLGEYDNFCYQLNGDHGKFQTSIVISKDPAAVRDSVMTEN